MLVTLSVTAGIAARYTNDGILLYSTWCSQSPFIYSAFKSSTVSVYLVYKLQNNYSYSII